MNTSPSPAPLQLDLAVEQWDFRQPVRLSSGVVDGSPVVVVTLRQGAHCGRGEALGVHYRGESVDTLLAQLETGRDEIEAGLDRDGAQRLLPCGGARNALDCALWDLEAQRSGVAVATRLGLAALRARPTTVTLGVDAPETMAQQAAALPAFGLLKLKLDGSALDAPRVEAVRAARTDATLTVDANQGWTPDHLCALLPTLQRCGVALIEQPLPAGRDDALGSIRSPIPFAADESLQGLADLDRVAALYQAVNLKLDKTGGLSEALAIVAAARTRGLGVMVGCMGGTSLSIAPAFVLAQFCDWVDLDGPLFLRRDREPATRYAGGALVEAGGWGLGA